MTTWAHFDVRFDSILVSLARHSDLITQEATTVNIIEAKQWRDRMDSETALKEKERTYRQRVSVISWLGLDKPTQDDECERAYCEIALQAAATRFSRTKPSIHGYRPI